MSVEVVLRYIMFTASTGVKTALIREKILKRSVPMSDNTYAFRDNVGRLAFKVAIPEEIRDAANRAEDLFLAVRGSRVPVPSREDVSR